MDFFYMTHVLFVFFSFLGFLGKSVSLFSYPTRKLENVSGKRHEINEDVRWVDEAHGGEGRGGIESST